MADIKVQTWVHRYAAAELWETDSYFVKIKFNERWTSREGFFDNPEEAESLAKSIAAELGGTYQGHD